MKLFGKELKRKHPDTPGEEASTHQADAQAKEDLSLADVIPEVASSPAAAKAVADIIAIGHWTCSSCQCVNNGIITCQQCGEPISDEEFLAPLRIIASLTAAEENDRPPMAVSAAMPDGAPASEKTAAQSWVCPFCDQTNQGNFCESCGAQKP